MRLTQLYPLVLVAALTSACAAGNGSLPQRPSPAAKRRIQVELSKYEGNLKLSILPEHDQVVSGESLVVKFTLHNDGPENLEPCLAERGAIHFFGLDKRYAEATEIFTVDHPFCKLSLPVAGGKSVSWSRVIIVPSIPSSTAKLRASIYLVDARDCDRYGCYGVSLSADASPITVTNSASSASSEAVMTSGLRPTPAFERTAEAAAQLRRRWPF